MTRLLVRSLLALLLSATAADWAMVCLRAQTLPEGRTQAQSRRRPPTTREALDRYLGGDFDGAVRGTPMLPRFDTAGAEQWIGSAGQAGAERRRLAAAMFVLEYSAVRPHQIQAVMRWARTMIADPRASHPAEALWWRASIALGQGLDLWAFLTGAGDGHIDYARRHLPNDQHIQLAAAVAHELQAARLGRGTRDVPGAPLAFDRIMVDVRDNVGTRSAARAAALERAAELLEGLTSMPAVSAEAHLRLGFVRLRQGRSDAALLHFDQVNGLTRDSSQRYLGHLYAGWALAHAGRPGEAISAYRAALRAVPHAQSATALLVALMMTTEQLGEAEEVADAFLAREGSSRDPWQLYFLGDGPDYGSLVLQLREALR